MYRAFNLSGDLWGNIARERGDAVFKQNSDAVRKSLESFLNGEIVDGTKLSDHWFPTIKADVFISHSHKDRVDAIKCAGWIKNEFGLNPFVDSCVWGHADGLLKIIDDKYCLNPNRETYSYEKRNGSTSHVHMMLSTALSSILDTTECVIFIKTDNSITSSKSVDKTQSPWLFFELATMRVIRRKKPARTLLIENFANEVDEMIRASRYKAEYEVPLSELTPLNASQLEHWRKSYQANKQNWANPLDHLYEIAPM